MLDRGIDYLVNEHIKALSSKVADPPRSENAISLDKNELPFSPSPSIIKAIADASTKSNRYPEILGGCLREALANYTGTKKEQIFLGNGSDDLIELIAKVFVKSGDDGLLPIPTFFVYKHAIKIIGGNPIYVNRTDDFGLDVNALLQKVTSKTKVVFIANPNNPTANLVSRNVILEVLNNVKCIVVIDECYYEICQETVIDLVDRYPNLIVLRSLSKSFGLAGLRIGYGIANETLVDYLYRAAQMFPVNNIAMIAGIVALTEVEYARSNIEKICLERKKLTQALEQLGFFVYPSSTNFLFVKTKLLEISSYQLVQALSQKNIFVKDFGLQPSLDAYYFRTSVGTPRENQALLEGLAEVISKLSNSLPHCSDFLTYTANG